MYRLLLFPALLLLSGCGSIFGPTACTLIGCESGVEVAFAQRPDAPFRIEAEVPGHPSSRYVYECDEVSRCGGRIFFADFTPDVVRIRVVTAAGTTEQIYSPQYSESRPNGPDCEPLCRTARIMLPLPGRA